MTSYHKVSSYGLPAWRVPCVCLAVGAQLPIVATLYQTGDLVDIDGNQLPMGWYYWLAGSKDNRFVLLTQRVYAWAYAPHTIEA